MFQIFAVTVSFFIFIVFCFLFVFVTFQVTLGHKTDITYLKAVQFNLHIWGRAVRVHVTDSVHRPELL